MQNVKLVDIKSAERWYFTVQGDAFLFLTHDNNASALWYTDTVNKHKETLQKSATY